MPAIKREQLLTLLDECIKQKQFENKSPKTIKNLRNGILRLAAWLNNRELSIQTIREFQKQMMDKGMARSSVASESGYLKIFLKWLFLEKEAIPEDWAKLLRPVPNTEKYQSKPPDLLPSAEKLLEAVIHVTTPGKYDNSFHRTRKTEYRLFFLFMFKMGLRIREAMGVERRNIRLDGIPRMSILRKGGEWQLMGLPLDFINEITDQLKKKSKNGTLFNVNQCQCEKYMHQVSKYLGMRVGTHTGRKINSTGYMENGAPIGQTAKHMGHTVKTMEHVYYKNSPKDSSQIMNAYGPFIDKSKVPAEYTMNYLSKVLDIVKQHPDFDVVESKEGILIKRLDVH